MSAQGQCVQQLNFDANCETTFSQLKRPTARFTPALWLNKENVLLLAAFILRYILQGVFLTGTPPKNSKHKKVNLG